MLIGGAGFIGGNLAANLVNQGRIVRILDAKPAALVDPLIRRTDYIEGSIGDTEITARALKDIDVVFHLACNTLPQSSNDDMRFDIESNLVPTIDLLNESVKSRVKKVIFVSSGGTVYGTPDQVPIPEEHPTNPLCSYGISKLAIEKYLHLFYHLHQLNYNVLRLSNPYGPGQDPLRPQGVISVFLDKYLAGKPIQIWGDGEVVRDYLYIDDAISAMTLAAETSAKEHIFNVGSGEGVSLKQIVGSIEAALDIKLDVEYLPARKVDVPKNILDIRKIREHLGWSPKTDLITGIQATWAWLKNRKETKLDDVTKSKTPLLF